MIAVFDAHCDLISRCYTRGESLLCHNPGGQVDLERTEGFSAYAQFFALFANGAGKTAAEMERVFKGQCGVFFSEIARNRDRVCFCRSGGEAREANANGKAAAFLSVEGAELLRCDLSFLDAAFALGVRAVNLTWNHANALSGSHCDEPERGLSDLGRRFVSRMLELGMLADVSHLSPRGFRDVVELAGRAGKPVMASHSNARALWGHTRNLQDGEFTAIASTGGVAGVNLYAGFLGESPTMDTVCAHIEHFLALDGADTHIALGGDWDGCDELPGDMQDGIAALPRLYERLLQRNHRESTLQNIFYQNLMRVVNDVCTM